ncbi:CLUMA_CG003821, isoform A [Clunio marinus]|uniref:CLUMA_CG003821, isoform A n=1 Tax=Clunio marinus TaxID=568069 RepID=A0A1J1HPX4_9DIPT|nr:CLUMA_CG003821, isoform A [Clunio marinus]
MFGVLDYLVFAVTLLISIGIGIFVRYKHKQKSSDEFLLASRSMEVWPVAFSLMASLMSAITLLGVSNENYQFGTQFVIINISYGIATPIAVYLFLPIFYNLRVTSAYEYLELRFGKYARISASLAYSTQMILYMGIVLYAPALAFESVIGIDKNIAIIMIGLTVIFYCCIGGIRAVLLTDVFQAILMFVAIFLVIISGVIHADGVGNIFKAASNGNRLEFFNFNPDPTTRHSWFSQTIGGLFTYLSLYAVNQMQVQRLLTVKSLKEAQMALWWNWPILTALSLLTSFSGLVIYYYYQNCDPLLAGRITQRDQNMAIYVMDALGHIPGIAGLFVSGIYSASLSSISSCLNSLAAVTIEDYVKPIYLFLMKRPLKMSPQRSALPSKIIAGVYGIICIGTAYLAQHIGGILQISLTIFGVVGGPLLALFTLGMGTKRANEKGSIIGLVFGVVICMWIGFGQPKPPPPYLEFSIQDCSQFGIFNITKSIPEAVVANDSKYFYLYRISYLYTVVIGFVITFTVGYLTSLLKGQQTSEDNDALMNYELYFPHVAKSLRKNQAKLSNNLLNNELTITKL